MTDNNKKEWGEYSERERREVSPLLKEFGFWLDSDQIHTLGERYLMSGEKLVLVGYRDSDGKKMIIKVSSSRLGKLELLREHQYRETILKIKFSYRTVLVPNEILFERRGKFVISISEFIEETKAFLLHDDESQFFLLTRAFEVFEGVHVTTYSHRKDISSEWKNWTASEYLKEFQKFSEKSLQEVPTLDAVFSSATEILKEGVTSISRYCGFLTHSDFVPHNIRVVGNDVILLDYTSLLFGNKYESMARLVNYLCLYNLELSRWILEYVRKNKGEEEYQSLRLMRIYKLGFLLQFYAGSIEKSEGDLRDLALLRVDFWKDVLWAVIEEKDVSDERIRQYTERRDELRSDEEKRRQKDLHQL